MVSTEQEGARERQDVKLTVVFPPDLHMTLKEIAKRDERSLQKTIIYALRQYAEAQGKPSTR